MPQKRIPLTPRQRIFAWAWLSHGACLVLLAGILGLAVEQIQTEEWAEAMTLVGSQHFIIPVRKIMPAVAAYAPSMVILGLLCVLAAALALWLHRRWAVQVMALIHFPMLVMVTWWSHQLSAQVLPLGWGDILGEVVVLGICLATVGWSFVEFNRPGSAASAPSPGS